MVEHLDIEKKSGSQNGGSVNADGGLSDQTEFSFENELKEYKGLVADMQLSNVQDGISAELVVVTLEGIGFKLDWSVANGMKILATGPAGQKMEEKPEETQSYEDLNQLLQGKSPAYQAKFNEKLMEKLSKINKDISGESGRKSPEI